MKKRSIIYRGSLFFDKRPEIFIKHSIESARKWFDGEIIVSTWKHHEKHLLGIDGIDKVILTEDPGSGPIQQMNRQLTSYMKGVENSNGDEILVTRSDIAHDKNIFDFLYKNTKKNNIFNIFKNKIVVGNMMTISPSSNEKIKHFRINDWFHCGTKEDIFQLGDIKNTLLEQNTNGMDCTEQAWSLCLIKKYIDKNLNFQNFEEFYKNSLNYMVNNFDIYNTKTSLGVTNYNWYNQPEFLDCYITEEEFISIYNKILN